MCEYVEVWVWEYEGSCTCHYAGHMVHFMASKLVRRLYSSSSSPASMCFKTFSVNSGWQDTASAKSTPSPCFVEDQGVHSVRNVRNVRKRQELGKMSGNCQEKSCFLEKCQDCQEIVRFFPNTKIPYLYFMSLKVKDPCCLCNICSSGTSRNAFSKNFRLRRAVSVFVSEKVCCGRVSNRPWKNWKPWKTWNQDVWPQKP